MEMKDKVTGGVGVAEGGRAVAVDARRVGVGSAVATASLQARIANSEKTEMSNVRAFLGLMGSSMATLTLGVSFMFPYFRS